MENLFQGRQICLTAPREGDDETMAKWYEDSDYLRNVDTDLAFPKAAGKLGDDPPGCNAVFEFRVREKAGGKLVGFVALHSVEWGNQTALLAVGIGDADARGRGYGREAIELALQYAFYELGLHRVGLDVIAYNQRAVRLYEQLGFVREGRARQCVYRDGERHDRIYMGLLREEWQQRDAAPGCGVVACPAAERDDATGGGQRDAAPNGGGLPGPAAGQRDAAPGGSGAPGGPVSAVEGGR